MNRSTSLLAAATLIGACASELSVQNPGGAVIQAQAMVSDFSILAAPKTLADVNHYTFELRDNGTNALVTSTQTTRRTIAFTSIQNGTYKLTAEAFSSADDSVSITTGGAQISSNTVTVTLPTVTYSSGNALMASLSLLSGTGESVGNSLTVNNGVWSGPVAGANLYWRAGYAAMPTARNMLAAASVNGKIYAIGGDNGAVLNTVEEFDPATNAWTAKANLPVTSRDLAAAAYNGKIYVMGGWNGSTWIANVYEYNPGTNGWTAKASLPVARSGLRAAVANGKIYAVGGANGGYQNSCFEYDPVGDTWATKTAMTTAREMLGLETVNGLVYAIGGRNGGGNLTTVERFDPVGNNWTARAAMPTARFGLASGAVGNRIYAIGGTNGSSLDVVEEYDPVGNTWATKPSMLTARRQLPGVTVGDFIYAVGGYNGGQLSMVERYAP